MKNVSTPLIPAGMTSPKRPLRRMPAPRKSTIMQLQQFARSYTCVPSMPVALGAFVAN
ncbi:MAG: hypothetical protein K2H14_09845 [Muribaculaceae bacterium]|nr:hypothetical protein [Muribaculaceae bacterium]